MCDIKFNYRNFTYLGNFMCSCEHTSMSLPSLDGGGRSTPRFGRLTPGKDPVPIVQEAGWALGPVWTGGKSRPPPEFDPQTVQLVASRYTD